MGHITHGIAVLHELMQLEQDLANSKHSFLVIIIPLTVTVTVPIIVTTANRALS